MPVRPRLRRAKIEDLDGALPRADYVEYWAAAAAQHAIDRGWRANTVALTTILESTFDRAWLEALAREPDRTPIPGDRRRHPLGRMLATPSPRDVARVIELAICLKHCAPFPRAADVAAHLRVAEQFEGAFTQLALAYHLRRAGCTAIEFEPEVDDDRHADLLFGRGGTTFVLECYETRAARFSEYDELIANSTLKLFDAARSRGVRVVFRIEVPVASKVTRATRLIIESEGARLMERVRGRTREHAAGDGYEIEVFGTDAVAESQVRELAFSLATWDSWVQMERAVPRKELRTVHATGVISGPTLSCGVICRGDAGAELTDTARRLADRIEKKVSQVRRRGTKGIIVVQSAVGGAASRGEPDAIAAVQRVRKKILGAAHPRVAAVWLVEHGVADDQMPFVGGIVLEGAQGREFGAIANDISKIDELRDILDDPAMPG